MNKMNQIFRLVRDGEVAFSGTWDEVTEDLIEGDQVEKRIDCDEDAFVEFEWVPVPVEYILIPGGISFPNQQDALSALEGSLVRCKSAYVIGPDGERIVIEEAK